MKTFEEMLLEKDDFESNVAPQSFKTDDGKSIIKKGSKVEVSKVKYDEKKNDYFLIIKQGNLISTSRADSPRDFNLIGWKNLKKEM